MKSVIVGTAGHIDHGKTALVKALTGIDADRLEEEKRRGITIDIGFAHLELVAPGGEVLRLGFVDVPGHERFVRNMLAGTGGIDVVLLVIAADESIKPQTREHFDICRLLSIRRGITVLTKCDKVDRDTLEVVRLEVADFLRGSFLDPARSPIMPVSSLTGEGLDALRQALIRVAAEVSSKDAGAMVRLPVDRVFTMKGFGTVVTGTLVSGTIRKEEELQVFPKEQRVRVRGVQVHGRPAEQAVAGERTALNLASAATEELSRGMMLAMPGVFSPTRRPEVTLSLLSSAKPMKDRARVHLHVYTAETVAEVVLHGQKQLAPGQTAFAQLRLADPVLLLPEDRFIVRQFSPVVTIGGGIVLDVAQAPHREAPAKTISFLHILAESPPPEALMARIARRGKAGLPVAAAVAQTGWRRERLEALAGTLMAQSKIVRAANVLVSSEDFRAASGEAVAAVTTFHQYNPLVAGISREALRERLDLDAEIFSSIMETLAREKKLEIAGEIVRSPGHGVVLKDEETESKKVIETAFSSAGLKVPALKDVLAGLKVDKNRAQKIVTLLLRDKVLVKISEDLVFHRDALQDLRTRVVAYKSRSPKIDVAQFKDMTGVSRKYAIPLLEYLDRERVTRRKGDEREIL